MPEESGAWLLNVLRGSDAIDAVTVDYALTPDTATPDADYTPIQGTLIFAPTESSVFQVP